MGKHIGTAGCQWGDEGKGRIIDKLNNDALQQVYQQHFSHLSWDGFLLKMFEAENKPILNKRFQGGANAGHTLEIGGVRMALHQIPSGIMTPGTFNLMDYGVYFEPRGALKEIDGLHNKGVVINPRMFGISSKAHMTLDYHLAADKQAFEFEEKWATTGSGIKQTSSDKVNRVGIRFAEFLDRDVFESILRDRFGDKIPGFCSVEEFVASYDAEREVLKKFMVQSHKVKLQHGDHFHLSEGAQGIMLGVDKGDYPGVTSSNPSAVPDRPDTLLGVYKMYCSSVGTRDRAFVSRMPKKLEAQLHKPWREFGTKTGGLREIGWFDALQARYAAEATGIDYAVFTCIDKLELLHEMGVRPQIVVGYKIDGKEYFDWDPSFDVRGTRERAEPIFDNGGEGFDTWETSLQSDGITFTDPARRYIDRIQELVGVEVAYMSVGAERDKLITNKDLLKE